jgi:hypothetical protein
MQVPIRLLRLYLVSAAAALRLHPIYYNFKSVALVIN